MCIYKLACVVLVLVVLITSCIVASWQQSEMPESGSTQFTKMPPESTLAVHCVGNITVTVTDTGAGISADHQKHLFQEGRQFNANRLQGGEGSGLGLFIAKGVVELHDGSLSAYSPGEGCGCTFTMVLPAVQVRHERSADGDSIEEGIGVQLSNMQFSSIRERAKFDYMLPDVNAGGTVADDSETDELDTTVRHVLVVDDSHPSRKMMARLLSNAGYQCTQACDGEECVDIIVRNAESTSETQIRMVFMDYEMPRMNGPQACKVLRDKGFTIPIIGVTGNVLPSDNDFFLAHGADVVLSKPLDLNKLNQVISQFGAAFA